MARDPGPFLRFKLTDTSEIEDHIQRAYDGLEITPRTVEDALRRGDLEFYQVGQKRYTTPKLIDEWMASLITRGPQRVAAAAKS